MKSLLTRKRAIKMCSRAITHARKELNALQEYEGLATGAILPDDGIRKRYYDLCQGEKKRIAEAITAIGLIQERARFQDRFALIMFEPEDMKKLMADNRVKWQALDEILENYRMDT